MTCAGEMKLQELHIHAFRNIDHAELAAGERFNIFHGRNAQGKTNLLEAIFLLGTMKSFRTARNRDLIQWGAPFSLLKGRIDKGGVAREIALVLSGEGKRARVDQKPLTKLSDFFGHLNVVAFAPEEIAMAKGLPDARRRYLDRAVFSGDPGYLPLHLEFTRILRNRNALLRNRERAGLDVWTEKLAEAGFRLMEKRVAYLEDIRGLLDSFYNEIAGSGEKASVSYRPHRMELERLLQGDRSAFADALARSAEEEERRGTTLAGPHRDDVEFSLNGKVLKEHASQGQQRSFVLALKMAEIEHIRRRYGAPPVLLLDDMTSELDGERNRNLMTFLEKSEMQVFITTTDLHNIRLNSMNHSTAFRVADGKILR